MSQRRTLIQRFALALLLAVGGGIVWGFAIAWIAVFVSQLLQERQFHRQFIVGTDGTPCQTGFVDGEQVYFTVEGEPLDIEKQARPVTLLGASLGVPNARWPLASRLPWGQRLVLFTDRGPPRVFWYFVHDGRLQGAGYFVGYQKETNREVGYIGRQGFSDRVPPPEQWFPVDGRRMLDQTAFSGLTQSYYQYQIWEIRDYGNDDVFPDRTTQFASDGKLWEVDFRKRAARVLLEHEDLLSFGRLDRAIELPSDGEKKYLPRPTRFLAVRLSDRVLVIDPRSGERQTYQIPESLQDVSFSFYALRDGKAIATFYPQVDPEAQSRLAVFDAQGQILSQAMIPATPARWHNQPPAMSWTIAAGIPAPIVSLLAAPLPYAEHYYLTSEEPTRLDTWLRGLSEAWPQILVVFALGALLAWWVYRRQQRLAQPWTRFWTVFVFLTGLPGLIGYLVHRRWPVVLPCPHCQKAAPRDRDVCIHCGDRFPPPAPQGIEIFAA